ncbi:DUF5811 family protein [Halococcus saccharolyticus]|uniref:Uncharacterized protein n=1 Tax=Halococcus saccharolyticus DSM 5350 TaxID=1227455 RepID=M0MBI4_9EURY|nr:DUF5811 family protein [Halococcus saccharolyticus]EMA43137.1 hypothetical protein C449_14202 [Halococcus saccharolyticus DSM 5350]
MNGNTPYAGRPDATAAGQRASADVPELSADERRELRAGLDTVAARTREFLPDEYVVGAQIVAGTDGPEGTIAVQPPVGPAVSAGFTPDAEELVDGIPDEDRDEVAHQLAATAALQVKQAVEDAIAPVAQ